MLLLKDGFVKVSPPFEANLCTHLLCDFDIFWQRTLPVSKSSNYSDFRGDSGE
jgi:hypothetical protein